jgi:serine/threonine-protein kinase
MSPEQAHGFNVDHRTDIYALGCVAYELVLGVRPFPQAQTAPEIYAAHLHESPPLPRSIWLEIPPQLDRLLFAMLAKDRAHRPTLAQVRSVVTGLHTSTFTFQQTATAPLKTHSLKKRPRRAAVFAFMIGALVTGTTLGAAIGTTINAKNKDTQPRRLTPSQSPPPVFPAPSPTPSEYAKQPQPQNTSSAKSLPARACTHCE